MRLGTIMLDGRATAVVESPGRGLARVTDCDPGLPGDLLGLLRTGLDGSLAARLSAAAERVPDERLIDPDTAVRTALYRRPRKLWGIGLNYRAHADDLDADYPEEPASFLKADHTIIGPGEAIRLPPESDRVTTEGELGLVIGRTCWRVGEDEALSYVAGVCPLLDQTAEDILQRNPRFLTRSKNFPTFLSLGSPLVTTDEVLERFGELERIVVATYRNEQLHRENTVGNMAYPPAFLVSFHSQLMPLYPGDIIATGTPGAVVVHDGDVAECRIDGVGALRNPVRRADPLEDADAPWLRDDG